MRNSIFNLSPGRTVWVLGFFLLTFLDGIHASPIRSQVPLVSMVFGTSHSQAFGPATIHGNWGSQVGFTFSSTLPAGDVSIPMDWGLTLRSSSFQQPGWYDRDVFTELQCPLLFHPTFFGFKHLEMTGLWVPSYTLDMVATSPIAKSVPLTEALRTRFNMGFGGGLQALLPWGMRLRTHWVYSIFSPYRASRLTRSDVDFDLLFPLAWGDPK